MLYGYIQAVAPKDEKIFFEQQPYADLGIRSRITAVVLNYLLDHSRKMTFLFNYGGAHVTINDLHELGISFSNGLGIIKKYYARSAWDKNENTYKKTELIKITKRHFAKAFKHLWDLYSKTDPKTKEKSMLFSIKEYGELNYSSYANPKYVIPIPDNYPYSPIIRFKENHFHILYGYLKGKDRVWLTVKYGKDAVNNILGEPIENQFVISGIGIIKNEIKNLIEKYAKEKDEANSQEREEKEALIKKFEKRRAELYDDYTNKMESLRKEMMEMVGITSSSLQLRGEEVSIGGN